MTFDEDWEEWNPERGSFIHHMTAGSLAGVTEHVAIFPMDTVKTHMQCQRCPINESGKPLSVLETASQLMKKEGPLRLFRGVGAMFGACIPAHAAYFSIFESCKRFFGADQPGHHPVEAGACGAFATVAHDIIMTPMDVAKQRLQLGYYTGPLNCIRTIIRSEGIRALYLSFPTTLFMNIPYGIVVIATNESLKKVFNPSQEHNIVAYLLSGAGAGAMAAVLTTPLDVAKTRLQTQSVVDIARDIPPCLRTSTSIIMDIPTGCDREMLSNSTSKNGNTQPQYKGLVDVMMQIRQKEGFRGFFRGAVPRVLLHVPAVAISWTTYETAKYFLDSIDN